MATAEQAMAPPTHEHHRGRPVIVDERPLRRILSPRNHSTSTTRHAKWDSPTDSHRSFNERVEHEKYLARVVSEGLDAQDSEALEGSTFGEDGSRHSWTPSESGEPFFGVNFDAGPSPPTVPAGYKPMWNDQDKQW